MTKLNKVLTAIIFLLLAVILLGTVLGLFVFKHKPGENLRTSDPTPQEAVRLNNFGSTKMAAYTELGTIRCVTKAPEKKAASKTDGESGVLVIITPWLSYPEGDTILFEELSRKRLTIKGIFQNYFSGYTEAELLKSGEEKIKADLLELINRQMSLGTISAVYFSEYIFFK